MKFSAILALVLVEVAFAQDAPYDVFPDAQPPYHRVRYDASPHEEKLQLAVQYTIWIPPNVKTLRGVVVHQHGCGEGSCRSGLTGAFDLHWQALAAKHECALLSPAYEQPQKADCQLWCDPRNGSDAAFQQALVDLGQASHHPELASLPWALWGHSGGATWVGGMTLLHPDRVAAAWLRSGVPLVVARPDRPSAKTVELPDKPLPVPMMLNLGTKEGVTVTDGRFSGLWPNVQRFFKPLRERGGLIGIAIDPLTGHECGNQRYLAIPWFDACLELRLPTKTGEQLQSIANEQTWLATVLETTAVPEASFTGDKEASIWLPNQRVAEAWMQYVADTNVADSSPPPPPTNMKSSGGELTWDAAADLESGIAYFIIERDGKQVGKVPPSPKNPFGRPLFQGLLYSDTPTQPLVRMRFSLNEKAPADSVYQVISVNSAGLRSSVTQR